jgi:hypothetical protein
LYITPHAHGFVRHRQPPPLISVAGSKPVIIVGVEAGIGRIGKQGIVHELAEMEILRSHIARGNTKQACRQTKGNLRPQRFQHRKFENVVHKSTSLLLKTSARPGSGCHKEPCSKTVIEPG